MDEAWRAEVGGETRDASAVGRLQLVEALLLCAFLPGAGMGSTGGERGGTERVCTNKN